MGSVFGANLLDLFLLKSLLGGALNNTDAMKSFPMVGTGEELFVANTFDHLENSSKYGCSEVIHTLRCNQAINIHL